MEKVTYLKRVRESINKLNNIEYSISPELEKLLDELKQYEIEDSIDE